MLASLERLGAESEMEFVVEFILLLCVRSRAEGDDLRSKKE
jgi:hypothetical protein